MEKIAKNLIAPCGMNCGVCVAHLREKNRCAGCKNGPTKISCLNCKIRSCTERKGEFCYDCANFSCDRLKNLDKRYRAKYGMSEIANLISIRDQGIESFVKSERHRWQSEKGVFCVHSQKYYI